MGDELDDMIWRMQEVLDFKEGTGGLPPEFFGPTEKALAQDIQILARRLKALEQEVV